MKKSSLLLSSLLIFLLVSQAFAAPEVATYDGLLHAIRETRAASQGRIEAAVEQEKVREAWETGKLIVEHILLNKERADYGERVVEKLAVDLAMSKRELQYMVEFARAYPIVLPGAQLSWSHYKALLDLKEADEREALIREATQNQWNRDQVREEVRRRNASLSSPNALIGDPLPEISPGPLNTYQIIRLKDRLKIDLGFGIYRDLDEKSAKKFKEGDIVENRGQVAGTRQPSNLSPVSASRNDLFTYQATVTSVVDGDTFHALIDLGLETTLAQRVRLRRIDAPEILMAEGKEAKAYLEKILSRDGGRILLQSRNLDQHGRPIADVWVKGKPVDHELLNEGLAVRISE